MSRLALPLLLIGLQACVATPSRRSVLSQPSPAPAPSPPLQVAEAPADDPDMFLGPSDDAVGDEPTERPPSRFDDPTPREHVPHPFAELSDDDLEAMLLDDPTSLGPMSLGRTNAGALFNGVQMHDSPLWTIVNPRQTWGTTETIEALARAIERVHAQFPDTEPLYIGDISERSGGPIDRHLSHQSGRDVDLGFYYNTPHRWYARADANNLDLPRTWAFVKALVSDTDVERIFIDHAIQRLLKDYALAAGEDAEWLDWIFGGETASDKPLILHEDGHDTHIHVRFYNPVAQETGRRLYRLLIAHKKISPPTYYVEHKVVRGDTLNKIARKYNTTVAAIKKASGLTSNRIIAGRKVRIPRRGGVIPASAPLALPERRLPPRGDGEPTFRVASPER